MDSKDEENVIEITPAMLSAGERAYDELAECFVVSSVIAKAVYIAMRRAQDKEYILSQDL
jgi:hypothetical protein